MTESIRIYVGPTLHGTGLETEVREGISWAPPVRRGDIERLLKDGVEPATLAIVDGTFHSYPSVSHHEIRHALEAGWRIYGLSSMGAIRACEMAHLGMIPFGTVAARYLSDPDFNDDEVTLVHGADEPYVPLSEPLIHMREFLDRHIAAGVLSRAAAEAVLQEMQPRWYGERTLKNFRLALARALGVDELPDLLSSKLQNFGDYRVKQQDLLNFIEAKPWLGTNAESDAIA